MKKIKNTARWVVLLILLIALSGIMMLVFPVPADAKGRGSFSRGGGGQHSSSFSHGSGGHPSTFAHGGGRHSIPYSHHGGGHPASYAHHVGHHPYYHHFGGRYYPYHYYGWGGYCPWWPWSAVIPFLPLYYETIWIGNSPYYFADGIYYAPTAGGYMIVDPPQETVNNEPSSSLPPSEDRLFIYPRNGQSDKKQEDDRYNCHRWAVNQTGYDPTTSTTAPSPRKRADYQRAIGACLEAHGYTVR